MASIVLSIATTRQASGRAGGAVPSEDVALVQCHEGKVLGWAMRTLPVGTAYAVWTGIGAVGTVVLGVILFDTPMNPLRLISIALIVVGVLGLKLAS